MSFVIMKKFIEVHIFNDRHNISRAFKCQYCLINNNDLLSMLKSLQPTTLYEKSQNSP